MTKGFQPRVKERPKKAAPSPITQKSAKPWKPNPGIPTDCWLNKKRWLWIQIAYLDEHGEEQVKNKKVSLSVNQAETLARRMAMDLGRSHNPKYAARVLQHVFVLDGTLPEDMLSFPPEVAKYAQFFNPLNWIPSDIGEGNCTELRLHLPADIDQEELKAIASSLPRDKAIATVLYKD